MGNWGSRTTCLRWSWASLQFLYQKSVSKSKTKRSQISNGLTLGFISSSFHKKIPQKPKGGEENPPNKTPTTKLNQTIRSLFWSSRQTTITLTFNTAPIMHFTRTLMNYQTQLYDYHLNKIFKWWTWRFDITNVISLFNMELVHRDIWGVRMGRVADWFHADLIKTKASPKQINRPKPPWPSKSRGSRCLEFTSVDVISLAWESEKRETDSSGNSSSKQEKLFISFN